MAGGSIPLNDPTIFIDHRVPRQMEAPSISRPKKMIKFDPARPWIIHENVEQHVMEILIDHGMKPEEAYRVAHFEFAEVAEAAWYKFHDIDKKAAEKIQYSWLPSIQHGEANKVPPNLYRAPYPKGNVAAAKTESLDEPKPSKEETKIAYAIIDMAMPEILKEAQMRRYDIYGYSNPNHKTFGQLEPLKKATQPISQPKFSDSVEAALAKAAAKFKEAKAKIKEASVVPLPGEDPELEYQVRRKHKKLSGQQQKKLVSGAPLGGSTGVYGGGNVSY